MGGTPPPRPTDLTHLQYQPIPRQNTHFGFCFIKIGQDLLKLSWRQIWDTAYSLQRTAYSVQRTAYSVQRTAYSLQPTAYSLTMTPPEID